MDARLVAAITGSLDGVNVAGLCVSLGISRQSFYKWRARYRAEGLDGLGERSRRPRSSPRRLSSMVEDAIVELRKRLTDDGLDAGPASIRWLLAQGGRQRPPSEATIWRVLVRRGFVVPQPSKRPKSALRRFEADWPNERWQLDHTDWALADGTGVQILNLIDDHSRLCVASVAAPTITSGVLWQAFWAGGQAYGLPSSCLSDNGLVFSGKLRGYEVDFEVRLRHAGIRAVTARPFHPQTCGKVERFQQTLKKWLRARRRGLATLTELQAALDEFADHYNHRRPHRGIGRITPGQRWSARPVSRPAPGALPSPMRRSTVTITTEGVAATKRWAIHVGVEYAGRPAQLVMDDTHARVYVAGRLVRHLKLDRTRRYQASGRPRGRAGNGRAP